MSRVHVLPWNRMGISPPAPPGDPPRPTLESFEASVTESVAGPSVPAELVGSLRELAEPWEESAVTSMGGKFIGEKSCKQ